MSSFKDITNNKYGDFVAKRIAYQDESRHNVWECKCPNCGKTIYSTVYNLTHGRTSTICDCDNTNKSNSDYTDLIPIIKNNSNNYIFKYTPDKNNKDNVKDNTNDIKPILKNNKNNKNNKNVILTPITSDNDNNNNDNDSDNNNPIVFLSSNKDNYVIWSYSTKDLLSFPCYYYIAHCIPGDFTFGGKTAKKINELYNMEEKINREWGWAVEVGDVLPIDNVFNIIVTEKKYQKAKYSDMAICVQNLAEYCYETNVTFLAMPLIGSGSLGLDWSTVEDMILGAFHNTYDDLNEKYDENRKINIVFCDNTGKFE